MNGMSNNPLADMADIKGLDALPWWPLAIGWWFVIAIIISIFVVTIVIIIRKKQRKRTWQYQALQQLLAFESEQTHATVTKLSTLLKTIALQKSKRKDCASLTGNNWLTWLKQNDPKQFDWEKKGVLLNISAYAPPNNNVDKQQLDKL